MTWWINKSSYWISLEYHHWGPDILSCDLATLFNIHSASFRTKQTNWVHFVSRQQWIINTLLHVFPLLRDFFDLWVIRTWPSDLYLTGLFLPCRLVDRTFERVGGAYEELVDNFCERGGVVLCRLYWNRRRQEVIKSLRNKSINNDTDKEHTVIAVPQLLFK